MMFSSTDNMLPCPPRPLIMDRRWKGTVDSSPNCPRCDSPNTKFCYYNNYSLSQPRYFCKGCRRYWTKGGSLRNVPVGGGCRKSRRGKSVRLSTDQIVTGSSRYDCAPPDSDRSGFISEDPVGNSCPSDGNSTARSRSEAPAIDLALLYSKFLNQQRPDSDPGLTVPPQLANEFDQSLEFSNALDPSYQVPTQFLHEHQMGECQQPFDPIDAQLIGQFYVNPKQQDRIVQITSADPNTYGGMQEIPIEAINRDILWPAPPVDAPQPQEFESVTVDHFALNHSNLLNSNWNAFDLPSYEVLFSRP